MAHRGLRCRPGADIRAGALRSNGSVNRKTRRGGKRVNSFIRSIACGSMLRDYGEVSDRPACVLREACPIWRSAVCGKNQDPVYC